MDRKLLLGLGCAACLGFVAGYLSHECKSGPKPLSDNFYIAVDASEVVVDARLEAATMLSEEEKAIVRRLLTRSLSLEGGFTKTTLDAIEVLGVVGDPSTISLLEEVRKHTAFEIGSFNVAIERAILGIKSRH